MKNIKRVVLNITCPFCGKELTYHDEYIKYMDEVD